MPYSSTEISANTRRHAQEALVRVLSDRARPIQVLALYWGDHEALGRVVFDQCVGNGQFQLSTLFLCHLLIREKRTAMSFVESFIREVESTEGQGSFEQWFFHNRIISALAVEVVDEVERLWSGTSADVQLKGKRSARFLFALRFVGRAFADALDLDGKRGSLNGSQSRGEKRTLVIEACRSRPAMIPLLAFLVFSSASSENFIVDCRKLLDSRYSARKTGSSYAVIWFSNLPSVKRSIAFLTEEVRTRIGIDKTYIETFAERISHENRISTSGKYHYRK